MKAKVYFELLLDITLNLLHNKEGKMGKIDNVTREYVRNREVFADICNAARAVKRAV